MVPHTVPVLLMLTVPVKQVLELPLREDVRDTEADTQPLREPSGAEGVAKIESVAVEEDTVENVGLTLGEGVTEVVPLKVDTTEPDAIAEDEAEVEEHGVLERVAVGESVIEGEGVPEIEARAVPEAMLVPVESRDPEATAESEGAFVTVAEAEEAMEAVFSPLEGVTVAEGVAVEQPLKEPEGVAEALPVTDLTALTVATLLLDMRGETDEVVDDDVVRDTVGDTLTLGDKELLVVLLGHIEIVTVLVID